jgi:hypothetical protein
MKYTMCLFLVVSNRKWISDFTIELSIRYKIMYFFNYSPFASLTKIIIYMCAKQFEVIWIGEQEKYGYFILLYQNCYEQKKEVFTKKKFQRLFSMICWCTSQFLIVRKDSIVSQMNISFIFIWRSLGSKHDIHWIHIVVVGSFTDAI